MASGLLRLELENFKSYKGHQVIGPLKPFTAVIGPNGAGKSNLMDAISFVLGERTQNLRVRSVKDLIHGALIGKPVASRAKVTAVYVEEDGTEINFTRTIVPPGTEYRIDGKVVSHGQYQARLESLRVLIKAKNFLVFQGAVESIAMKTPKERTQLFEEISRSGELAQAYEEKKAAMTQVHEDTNFLFQKKKGIAVERKEARAEKEEAEKYQKLQKEIADCQLQEQLFGLFYSEKRIESLVEEHRTKQKALEKLTHRQEKIESQLKLKKQEAAKWSREASIIEKSIREREIHLGRKKPLYIKAKEKTLHVVKRLEATKKAHKKVLELHSKHKAEIKSLGAELEEVKRLAVQFEEELSEESQGMDLELMDTQVAEYHQLKELAGKRSSSLTQQLERLKQEQRTDEEAVEQTVLKQQDLESRKAQLQEQRTQHEEHIEKLDNYISTNTQTVNQLQKEYEKISGEVEQANLRYREVNEALEGLQEKLRDARVDSHENARTARRAEMLENLKRLYPGVYGRLIDLCEPVHRRYTVAITKVLGRNMDAIVVDHEKTGKDCIQYIKEQHSEPCTFLPLDTISAKPVNEALREIGGSAKLVYDVIRYEPAVIKRALLYACGNALVCDMMEEARKVAFGGPERRKAVSLDGTLFQKSGVISGGASDIRAKAKRWDEKQVDGLKRQREKCYQELKEVTQLRRKEPELQSLKANITGLEARLKFSKKDKEATVNRSLQSNTQELESVEREILEIAPRLANIQSSIDSRKASIAKLQSKIDKVDDEVFKDFCRSIGVSNIRQFEEKQLKGQQERAQKRLEFANQEARLKNQLDYEKKRDTKANVTKLSNSISSDESSITALQNDERDKLEEIETIEEAVNELKEKLKSLKKESEEQDVGMKEVKKMLTTTNKDFVAMQKRTNSLETEIDQRKADRHSLLKSCKMNDTKLPLSRGRMADIGDEDEASSVAASQSTSDSGSTAMMDIDSMSSQGARILYEREAQIVINYSKLDEKLKRASDEAEIQSLGRELSSKISQMESTLQRISAPNMKAVEKLDDVEARLQETAASFDKMRELSKKTKSEFELVKKQRCDRFMEAFDHVSTVIDGIYKKLSNNNSAQAFLGLENAEEPYLEGVSYNCIAPGKRYRPMDNLSGGEKTVAALALLFSIHSFQPAPFFVLDEIDAALDNTNISRVAHYITEETKDNFQCIVISLKEEFYSHSDAVTGIYAETTGDCTISRTLTHDLTQYPTTTSKGAAQRK